MSVSQTGIGFAEFDQLESVLAISALEKTPEAFASDPVWLRLSAGVCAQECAQVLRRRAHGSTRTAHSFPTFAFNSSKKFSTTINSLTPSTPRFRIIRNSGRVRSIRGRNAQNRTSGINFNDERTKLGGKEWTF